MSTLTMVRHGQASFLAADYDRLSELGERQSRRLGEYLAGRGVAPDEVIVGPLRRHAETERQVAETYREAGLPWPTPRVAEDLAEHNAVEVIAGHREQLGERFPHLVELERDFVEAREPLARLKAYGLLFDAVMAIWVRDDLEVPGLDSWTAFQGRVRRGIEGITRAAGRGSTVLAFTSGGPIAAAAQLATGSDDLTTLRLASRVTNASTTRFLFDGERFSLDAFNASPFLEAELETHL